MKRIFGALLISMLAFGCGADEKTVADSLPDTVAPPLPQDHTDVVNPADSTKLVLTHLSDTAVVLGDWIIFLRPDSTRFASYSEKLQSGIYDADADFGYACSMTIDTIIGNKSFKGIKAMISTRRFIKVMDCKECPFTIDRDTVNYGIILTGTGRPMKAEQNVYPGAHYIKAVRKYFGVK
ncbi:hypothetical protein BH11BAC7_BH11BAC7_11710 [soil metagenome]